MNKAKKTQVLIDAVVERISSTVTIPEFIAYVQFCKETFGYEDDYSDLLAFLKVADEDTFFSLCKGSIYVYLMKGLFMAMGADGEIDPKELDLVKEIVTPGMHDICRADRSYSHLYPFTSDSAISLYMHAKDARILRDYGLHQVSDLLVQLVSLKTGDLECYSLYSRVMTLAFRFVIESDGKISREEKRVESLWTDRLTDIRELHANLAESDAVRNAVLKMQATSIDNKSEQIQEENKKATPDAVLIKATDELRQLIGLSTVKKEINRLSNYLRIEKKRKEQGLVTASQSLHFIFTGNPGTGKTTVARIIAELLYGYQILREDKLVETERSNLVGGYVGQTAMKTREILDRSLDGVLFIDEAYTLSGKGDNDYGKEAIETILKGMEDNRDRLVVIAAGYTSNMREFLTSNPGLESRFTRFIDFPDYTPKELCKIFELMARKSEYVLTQQCIANLALIMNIAYSKRDEAFGNGRYVRNLFEKTVGNHSDRLVELEELSKSDLTTITDADLPYDVVGLNKPFDFSRAKWKARCPGCNRMHEVGIDGIGKSAVCTCTTDFHFPYWNLIADNNEISSLFVDYEQLEGHLLYE